MAFRYELTSMSPKIAQAASGQMQALFNAGLAVRDNASQTQTQMAQTLPQLNTESWTVSPDGRMETTYALRPNLSWHDRRPVTAEDFVFAWRVYAEPGLGFYAKPQDQMAEVLALDPQTVVIRWRSLYADAGELGLDFVPLPRHLIDDSYAAYKQSGDAQGFLNQPYWTTSFMGVGPFRLERWEPGAQLEAVAFEGYALGQPRIERIIARIFGDENTALANVLSGQVSFAMENTMRFEHGAVLKRDWVPLGSGVAHLYTSNVINNLVQFRPEYQKEPALLDVRVRRALAHSIDKQALLDGLYQGEGSIAHAAMSADDRFFPEVNRAISGYTYDPRRSEQLMSEAGYTKDREGYFAVPSGERFRPDFQVLAGTHFERGQAIITDTWWRAGFEVQPSVMSAVQVRDNLARATFPAIGMALIGAGGATGTLAFTSAQIGTPANRWSGSNRSGWSNAEFDRLHDAFSAALDRSERSQLIVQMMRLVNDEVPGFVMYFDAKVMAHATALRGPQPRNTLWNIHAWELR